MRDRGIAVESVGVNCDSCERKMRDRDKVVEANQRDRYRITDSSTCTEHPKYIQRKNRPLSFSKKVGIDVLDKHRLR